MEIDISDMHSYNETLQKRVRINLGHHPKLIFQIRSGRRTFERNHPNTTRYSAMSVGLQLSDCEIKAMAQKMPIQNGLIAVLMIFAFSRQEIITGKQLWTLGQKARKDTTSSSWSM
jgi:hypothetical protein